VPTTRPRFTITETDELKRALDEVARAHPDIAGDRNALFRRLVVEAVERYDGVDRRAATRAALTRIRARGLSYPPGYRAELRREWPE
jgi:hypothetical protein